MPNKKYQMNCNVSVVVDHLVEAGAVVAVASVEVVAEVAGVEVVEGMVEVVVVLVAVEVEGVSDVDFRQIAIKIDNSNSDNKSR